MTSTQTFTHDSLTLKGALAPTTLPTDGLFGAESSGATISPDVAATWIKRFAYPGQRRLSASHIAFLSEQMKAGTFRYCTLRLTGYPYGSESDGSPKFKWFLTNGQHRLHAVCKSELTMRFGVERVKVASKAEVAVDYAEQDNIRHRTFADSFDALALGDKWELTSPQLTKLQSASRIILNDFSLRPRPVPAFKSRNETARLIAPWSEPARQFFDVLVGTPNAALLSVAPVMATGLATLSAKPEHAIEFWGTLAADDGLKAGDARRTLLYFLRQTPRTERALLLLGVAACWAAFIEEREIVKCEFARDASFSLVGTLWEKE